MRVANLFYCSDSAGDIIIKEGTIGNKMYFIQEGVVDIVMANGEVSPFIWAGFLRGVQVG